MDIIGTRNHRVFFDERLHDDDKQIQPYSSAVFKGKPYPYIISELVLTRGLQTDSRDAIASKVIVSGLWALGFSDIMTIEATGVCSPSHLRPDNWRVGLQKNGEWLTIYPKGRLTAPGNLNEQGQWQDITADDLYISRETFIKLRDHSSDKDDIASVYNGQYLSPETNAPEKIIPEVNNNKIAEFLEMLIRSVPELGDEVMTVSANRRHNILKAFLEEKQREGSFTNMKMPASATIERYFKI